MLIQNKTESNSTTNFSHTETGHQIMCVIITLLVIFGIQLHCLGMYLILKLPKTSRPVSDIILLHLSFVDILLLATVEVWMVRLLVSDEFLQTWFPAYDIMIMILVNTPLVLTLIFLSLDRVAAVVLSIRYVAICTKQRYISVLAVMWVLAITIALVTYLTNDDLSKFNYLLTTVIVDAIYFVVIFLSYGYILFSLHRRRNKFNTENSRQINRRPINYKLPIGIMVSYILFLLVPHLYTYFYGADSKQKYSKLTIMLLYTFNEISDALLYIYYRPKLRKLAKQTMAKVFFCRCKQTFSADDAVVITNYESKSRYGSDRTEQHTMTEARVK